MSQKHVKFTLKPAEKGMSTNVFITFIFILINEDIISCFTQLG